MEDLLKMKDWNFEKFNNTKTEFFNEISFDLFSKCCIMVLLYHGVIFLTFTCSILHFVISSKVRREMEKLVIENIAEVSMELRGNRTSSNVIRL